MTKYNSNPFDRYSDILSPRVRSGFVELGIEPTEDIHRILTDIRKRRIKTVYSPNMYFNDSVGEFTRSQKPIRPISNAVAKLDLRLRDSLLSLSHKQQNFIFGRSSLAKHNLGMKIRDMSLKAGDRALDFRYNARMVKSYNQPLSKRMFNTGNITMNSAYFGKKFARDVAGDNTFEALTYIHEAFGHGRENPMARGPRIPQGVARRDLYTRLWEEDAAERRVGVFLRKGNADPFNSGLIEHHRGYLTSIAGLAPDDDRLYREAQMKAHTFSSFVARKGDQGLTNRLAPQPTMPENLYRVINKSSAELRQAKVSSSSALKGFAKPYVGIVKKARGRGFKTAAILRKFI